MKKEIYIKYVFIAVLLLFCGTVSAQNVNIKGKIVDNSQANLEFVTVSLLNTKDSSVVLATITNEFGDYQFSKVINGEYLVKATLFGYKNVVSKPILANREVQMPVLVLAVDDKKINLNEVVVVSKKQFIERQADKLVVNVENSSLAAGSSAFEVLQQSPGVSLDQNDNISLQGKNGVLVMIDGKQTYMSNADLVTMLKSMQSSELQSIEVITTPSAKYEAQGNAGIINIKTKKGKLYGTNGSVNANVSLGKINRANTGINLNHRTEKFNVFGNYNFSRYGNLSVLNIDRISESNPYDIYFSQKSKNKSQGNSNSYKIGTDFFINKNQTIGFLINGYNNKDRDNNNSFTRIGQSFASPDSVIKNVNSSRNKYDNMAYNLNYKWAVDTLGQELSADVDYSNYERLENAIYNNYFQDLTGNEISAPYIYNNYSPSDIDIASVKIDYTKPLKNQSKLELGYKSSWVRSDNNFTYLHKVNNQWENDMTRSNHFIYNENVNALYASYHKTYKKISFNVGLRAEQSNTKGNLVNTNKVVKRDYIDFFPTFFISNQMDDNKQISFSYSRRIDRPRYTSLNPFIYYIDQYTYNKGNPFLNPQYTNKFEVNYTLKSKYIFTVGYSLVNDIISDVILPDTATNALYQTSTNLDNQHQYNANVYIPIQPFKWWNIANNLTGFYMDFNAENLNGEKFSSGRLAFMYNMQNNFTISKTLSAEIGGNYISKMEYGTLDLQPQYSINLGVSKNLLNQKLNVKFAVTDVFNTFEQNIKSLVKGLNYDLYQKNESRFFRLSVNYKFGKNEIKPARRRSSGSEEEQNRL